MSYRFYVTIDGVETEVFPLNFLESKLVDSQPKGAAFYRRTFSGSLTFCNLNGNDDYDLLYTAHQSDPCERITFEVERDGVAYWAGYFAPTDGVWDYDKSTFEVTPQPNDDYSFLNGTEELQYDILLASPVITVICNQGPTTVNYTRNRFLIDVIEYLADKVKTGVTVSSTFFTNNTNPVTLHANHLKYLTIAQKSDIIRPTSTDAAHEAMLSWKELTDILWAMFQVQWNYNALTDTINVEHCSFFTQSAGLDLRTSLISQGKKFSYLKDEMPKYEKFSFMEAFNEDFVGTAIWYDDKCVNQDPESNVKETSIRVTTDLDYIIHSPLEIADDGFVILCNYLSGGNYYVELEGGSLSGESRANMHLSWANLQNRYFRHNRVRIQGYLNGTLTTFWSALKTIVQETFAIVCPADGFDPNDTIQTELGTALGVVASVKQAELNPHGEMKLQLVYGPAGNNPTEITDSKWIYLEESGICGHFYATFSEPVPVGGLQIIASHEVLDNTGTQVCTGGPETWTITAGVRNADFGFTLCGGGIPAGGCVNFAWTFPLNWNVTVVRMNNCEC